MSKKIKRKIFIFYLLIFGVLMAVSLIITSAVNSHFTLVVFDVGQGDAILIRTKQGQNILVDGGPDNQVVYKLGQYLPFYDRQIDLMVLTHPHADHLIGLIEVLKRYQVKRVWLTGVAYQSADYLAWLNILANQKIAYQIVDHRGVLNLDQDSKIEVLFPNHSLDGVSMENLNNSSIVLRLVHCGQKVMLTGDYEDEESLVDQVNLRADILKAGHHGSDTGNSLEFLKAVSPLMTIISCGQDNKFGHPHEATLDNLKQVQSQIWRTDQGGDYILVWP